MNTNGFLRTFIAVCSGTEVFPELIKRSFFRAVWHLIILTVICSFINMALRLHPFNDTFEECCANLSECFGKIEYSAKGITPTINPEKSHSASYADFRVDYLVDSADLKAYSPNKEFTKGIVWTPESVLFWLRYMEDEGCTVFPLLIPTSQLKSTTQMLELYKEATSRESKKQLFYTFSKMYRILPFENSTSTPFREFKSNVLFWIPMTLPVLYSVFLFFHIFLNALIISPIYILFFTSFSYLFGRSSTMNMKFPELYISGIYTGFPGIVIGTLYVALGLPGLDFQSVFLISYFVYSFAVFSRLRGAGSKSVSGKDS
jgi:hypothetical protein